MGRGDKNIRGSSKVFAINSGVVYCRGILVLGIGSAVGESRGDENIVLVRVRTCTCACVCTPACARVLDLALVLLLVLCEGCRTVEEEEEEVSKSRVSLQAPKSERSTRTTPALP